MKGKRTLRLLGDCEFSFKVRLHPVKRLIMCLLICAYTKYRSENGKGRVSSPTGPTDRYISAPQVSPREVDTIYTECSAHYTRPSSSFRINLIADIATQHKITLRPD